MRIRYRPGRAGKEWSSRQSREKRKEGGEIPSFFFLALATPSWALSAGSRPSKLGEVAWEFGAVRRGKWPGWIMRVS